MHDLRMGVNGHTCASTSRATRRTLVRFSGCPAARPWGLPSRARSHSRRSSPNISRCAAHHSRRTHRHLDFVNGFHAIMLLKREDDMQRFGHRPPQYAPTR